MKKSKMSIKTEAQVDCHTEYFSQGRDGRVIRGGVVQFICVRDINFLIRLSLSVSRRFRKLLQIFAFSTASHR